ncbi:ATP-binding protein [Streptosporangium sp. NPDC004379]|uniref:ATP-binding protein n=1 Tax=Streptosporangium sp. NPDC004379 TaxID=3366189 RepID=UPI0036B251D2
MGTGLSPSGNPHASEPDHPEPPSAPAPQGASAPPHQSDRLRPERPEPSAPPPARRGRHRHGAPVTAARPHPWDGAHRDSARRLDEAEPAWTVWYGVGTRRFYAVAAWPAPEPLIVHAAGTDGLRRLMRGAERAAGPYPSLAAPAGPNGGRTTPLSAPVPPSLPEDAMPVTPYGPRAAQWTLPHDLSVIGKTRGLVQEMLTAWGLGRLADDVVLAAGELLANTISYGEPLVRLTLRAEDGTLWIEVADRGPELPRRLNLGPDAVHGRGLIIVEALSDAFGVTPLPDTPGKTVWARWDLPR